jgi:NAD(P)-dependent dehydrogenase (short-subunit alcohol dehydrogenase family)
METSFMNLELKGKTAVVTGASMGLGRAIAKSLAAEGVTVFAVARTEDLLKSLAEEIVADSGPEPVTLVQDFVAPGAPKGIAAEALKALGQVDILINCAGGSRPTSWNASDEAWEEGFTLNFERHRQLTQADPRVAAADDRTWQRPYHQHQWINRTPSGEHGGRCQGCARGLVEGAFARNG